MTFALLLISAGLPVMQEAPSDDAADQQQPVAADVEYFETKIRPLLAERCYACHSADAKTVHGGLLLDSAEGIRAGGDSGPAIVAGEPDASLLITAMRYDDEADYQMPPKGKLPDSEIAEFTAWVKRGAPLPADSSTNAMRKGGIDFAAGRKFWSFLPVDTHLLPTTTDTGWTRERLDHFVLAAMEREGLTPSPEADRATLLRRLSFDLIGLPPTPDEVQAFVDDSAPDAYERQVDRLLHSPQFGERWARVWLDLARYTDTTASWLDSIGEPYLYRDWVVQAMNDDMPYDQFVHRQLATDLIADTGPEDNPALGFLGLSPNYWKELKLPSEIIKVIVADEWEERVDAVSRTFLGLTVACARCHDHKFDPIATEDYYALAGVFASCRIAERPIIDTALFEPVQAARSTVAGFEKQLAELRKTKPAPAEKIAALEAEIVTTRSSTPFYDSPMAPGVVEESLYVQRAGKTPQDGTRLEYKPQARDLPLFIRGNPNRTGDVVPRRFLKVLVDDESAVFGEGSGRLELARAITSDAQSLAARVIVNRIWMEHFGRGLVETPSNFGVSGSQPSHPKLLDDLAARLIDHGWSLKQFHREIVMSATYRQRGVSSTEDDQMDPSNLWLARRNRTRLNVEQWRDAMLAVSGQLNLGLRGPSVALADAENHRRTLYGTVHRREMSNMLLTHDFPDPTAHSPKRVSTTTTLQGLYALNGPLILARAEALLRRLESEQPSDEAARIERAYTLLFARKPHEREVGLGLSYLGEHVDDERRDAWMQYLHMLLASNEFLFVD